ncbi:unnamed protein product, partial [Laminaria digitata]
FEVLRWCFPTAGTSRLLFSKLEKTEEIPWRLWCTDRPKLIGGWRARQSQSRALRWRNST